MEQFDWFSLTNFSNFKIEQITGKQAASLTEAANARGILTEADPAYIKKRLKLEDVFSSFNRIAAAQWYDPALYQLSSFPEQLLHEFLTEIIPGTRDLTLTPEEVKGILIEHLLTKDDNIKNARLGMYTTSKQQFDAAFNHYRKKTMKALHLAE